MHNGIECLSAKEIKSKIVGGASPALVSMIKGQVELIIHDKLINNGAARFISYYILTK